ncbi:MAG: hypothetical protein ACE37K_03500 [Planctomycetota bacterium]
MKHLPLAIAAAAALAAAPAAQSCVFLPSDTPAVGAPDPRPFGNGNGADPVYGDMRYQVQVPAATFGNQPRRIYELFVAPAGSHQRTFSELQVRMGHNPNPTINPTMVFNTVGFTSRPIQYTQFSFQADADEWVPLGMAFPFDYDPQFGDLVLEFFVSDAAVEPGGTGDFGLRTDPSIPFVWTSGQGYNGTVVPGGGIKVRLCTDHYGTVEYPFGGCVGSNGLRPRLSYSGSPQIGSTLQVDLQDGPPANGTFSVLVFSDLPRIGPVDLTGIGMTGCDAHVFDGVLLTRFLNNGQDSFQLPLPATLPAGPAMWTQWFCLDLAANPFGLTASNVGRFMIGNTP